MPFPPASFPQSRSKPHGRDITGWPDRPSSPARIGNWEQKRRRAAQPSSPLGEVRLGKQQRERRGSEGNGERKGGHMSPCRWGRPLGRRRSDLCHVVGWYPTSVRQTGRLITAHRARRYMPQPAKSRPDMLIGRRFVPSGPRDMAWGISVSVLCPRPSGRSMGRPKGSRLASGCGDDGMVRAKLLSWGARSQD